MASVELLQQQSMIRQRDKLRVTKYWTVFMRFKQDLI